MRLSCCWGRAIMVRMKWPGVPETLSHCLFFALLCSTVKGSCIHPEFNPQKVRFNSTNLWHYVTWEPPRQMGSNLTYTVEYLKSGDKWRRVSDCTNIVRTRCDLRLTDEECEYWARVQVVWVGYGCSSEWVYTDCFSPLSDTDLKVLQFNVTFSDGIFVTTIMDSPTPHTKDGVVMTVRYFFPDLEYKVTCQETGTDKMTSLVSKEMNETGMDTKRTVTLPVPELGREYCFNATPVLWLNRGKCSHSEQKCLK
uniref:Fibronectin type-III domain-containing protein n=2 Tax=Eptatretus burgeri TaxID=7764 RepID=A0A8C4NDQ9_EPTBU